MDNRNTLTRVFDYLTLFLIFFLTLLLICGEFKFPAGSATITVNRTLHFALALFILFLLRWLLMRLNAVAAFEFSGRWRWAFMRLVEIGVAVHLIMIPVIFRHGDFQHALFASPSLGRALGVIYLLLWVRLIMGRHLRGLTLMISSTLTLVLVLVGMEVFLRAQETRQLQEAVKPQEVQAADPAPVPAKTPAKAAAEVAPPPDTTAAAAETAPIPDKTFDPTLNDGVNWTWGHRIEKNRHGFREIDYEVPKPADLFRIMILGDSLTWGAGLAPSQRYSDLLEAMLREAFPDQPVEVLNFGFQGGPTVRERDLLVNLGDEVDPDLIVIGYCYNDPQPRSQNYSNERARLNNLYEMIAKLRHVGLPKTYAYIISRIDHVLGRMDAIPTWEEALDRTYDPGSREWREFLEALGDIKQISDQRYLGPPVFIVLIQGIAGDKPDPAYYPGWFQQAGSAAAESGFVVVDPTTKFLQDLTMGDLRVNPRDGHPSAACNLIYAEELFTVVRPMLERAGGPSSQTGE